MVSSILSWAQALLSHSPISSVLVFVCLHTVLAILLLPCSPMTLIAGMLWGGVAGLVVSIVAALTSSAATFLLSRSVLKSLVNALLARRFPAVSDVLRSTSLCDWKVIALSQLNPIVPSSTMGYFFGLTRIPISRYLFLSAIFMIPLQLILVFSGKSIADLALARGNQIYAIGSLATLFVLYLGRKYFKLAVMQILSLRNDNEP